jgi:hypothetical protein
MLALSTKLAAKEEAGKRLTADEQIIADIVWVDVQVAPNGFDGWLSYTSNEAIQRTLHALDTVGCGRVSVLVRKALAVAGIDPVNMSDDAREAQLDSLDEADRSRLHQLDTEFYDAVGDCMERCRAFVTAHRRSFSS